MTIPYIDFRTSRQKGVGEQLLETLGQSLILEQFRKAAERRSEEAQRRQTAYASELDLLNAKSRMNYQADIALESAEKARVAEQAFQMGSAIDSGQLQPAESLDEATVAELTRHGAEPIVWEGTPYYSVEQLSAVTTVPAQARPIINAARATAGIGAMEDLESATDPYTRADVDVDRQWLQGIAEYRTAASTRRTARDQSIAQILSTLKTTPDWEQWDGQVYVDPATGQARLLTPTDMVGMQNAPNYKLIGQLFDSEYMTNLGERYDQMLGGLQAMPYWDPAEVREMASAIASGPLDERTKFYVNTGWLSGTNSMFAKRDKKGNWTRASDPNEAAQIAKARQPLMEALILAGLYNSPEAFRRAAALGKVMPNPDVVGYLWHFWRLNGRGAPEELAQFTRDFNISWPAEHDWLINKTKPKPIDTADQITNMIYSDDPWSPDYNPLGTGERPRGEIEVPFAAPAETGEPAAAAEGTSYTGVVAFPQVNVPAGAHNFRRAYSAVYSGLALRTIDVDSLISSIDSIYGNPEAAVAMLIENDPQQRTQYQQWADILKGTDEEAKKEVRAELAQFRNVILTAVREARSAWNAKNEQSRPPVATAPGYMPLPNQQ